MAYTVTDFPVSGNPKSIYNIGFRRFASSAYRLLVKSASTKAAGIFLSVLIHETFFLGFSGVAAASPADIEPGFSLYREQASQDGIESIDPYTGMLKVHHLDLFLPGNGGLDIKVMRTYDSANVVLLGVGSSPLPTMGYGWTFHFGKLVGSYVCSISANTSATRPVFELPDGTQYKFLVPSAGFGHLYTSKEGWVADCANSPDGGGLLVTSPEGIKYEMTVRYSISGISHFQVKKITDKQGNWLSFEYQLTGGAPNVVKCTSSDGRSVTFAYAPAATTSGARLFQVTTNGQTWRYDYTSYGSPLSPTASASSFELSKVTRPDGRTWTYEYPVFSAYYSPLVTMRGFLGKLTRPEGGQATYTYAYLSTGSSGARSLRITQKSVSDKVNPVSNWVYRYKFLEKQSSGFGLSITDIADPTGGLTTYKHETPYTASVYSDVAWRVGLLLEKLECSSTGGTVLTCDPANSTNREQNFWGNQIVSSEQYAAVTDVGASVDTKTFRPLLIGKNVTRDGTTYYTQYQSHDVYGNPARVVETGNNTSRTLDLTYYNDPVKWIVGQRDRETIDGAWVTERNFDANGNVISVIKNGVPSTFSYFTTGDLASATDANGNRTDYSDYFRGVPRREDQPGGVTILRTVNATGTVASETNGEGHLTQYAYDGLNRLTGVFPPAGNSTAIQWTSSGGAVEKRVTRGNFEEVTRFDGFGREIDVSKRDKAISALTRKAYQYDALGRKSHESYPTATTTAISGLPRIAYAYDNLGRLTKITHADAKTRQLQYLPGNQLKVINEKGNATTHSYRSFGDPDQRELMSTSTPVAAANLTVARNALGQITNLTQAGVTRTLQYDTRAYLVKTHHPEIGWVTYGRDAVGNPVSKSVGVAPAARVINFDYDARNRLTGTSYTDATTPSVILGYNQVDDVISATRGLVTRTYDYDANRNLVAESLNVDGRTFNLSYQYDGNDAAAQVTYPNGEVVNYYPDALGRPTAVSPYIVSIVYHPSGQVSGMTYANGVSASQAFNARQWPAQMAVSKAAAILINTGYGYDGLGNVTSIADSVNPNSNRTLAYDGIDRLVGATGPWGTGSIAYDGRGNILSQTYGSTYARTYTYDTANRLASYTGSTAFAYDAWGNATRSGTITSYHLYDDASNLYCASCDTASPLRFEYDANNYRVKKTRNGSTTYSLYAKDGNLMMEYTPSAFELKLFAYHNKKQVAMRRVVDPVLNLGANGSRTSSQFAKSSPRSPDPVETELLPSRVLFQPMLIAELMANAD